MAVKESDSDVGKNRRMFINDRALTKTNPNWVK